MSERVPNLRKVFEQNKTKLICIYNEEKNLSEIIFLFNNFAWC